MSAFIDNMAEESEGDSTDSEVNGPKAKKLKKARTKRRISSDEEEEEEEDDDARMQEEMRGFIVDQSEGEEEGDEDKASEKSDDEFGELSEEDLDVINENLGIEVGGRVQLSDDDDDEVVRQRIEKDLFDRGGGESPELEERGGGYERDEVESRNESEDSEEPFIVQDDATKRTKHRKRTHIGGISEHVVDEAREVFGVDDFNIDEFYEEDEEEEMEGEDEEFIEDEEGEEGMVERRPKKVKSKKETIMSTIEPSELEKGFVSALDKKILFDDKPERFQLRKVPVSDADEDEIATEAKWIYDYCFNGQTITNQRTGLMKLRPPPGGYESEMERAKTEEHRLKANEEAPEKIREALLKEYVQPWLDGDPTDLWKVYEYDERVSRSTKIDPTDLWNLLEYNERWCHLQARKSKLKSLMERMQTYMRECDSEALSKIRKISPKDEMNVDGVKTMEELADVTANFQLYYGHEISRMIEWEQVLEMRIGGDEHTRFKMSGRTDKYQLCIQCGLSGMAARFGLTAEQYAENLAWLKNELQQDAIEPLEAAKEYISENFPTSEDVLKGAIYMVAIELSRQPAVRDKMRRMYKEALSISVKATKKGRDAIDEGHPLYSMKYLKPKPAKEFKDDEYLRLYKGQADGLLEIKFITDESVGQSVFGGGGGTIKLNYDDFIQAYQRDEFHYSAQEWNKIRKEAILMCCKDMIQPALEREFHEKMLQEGREFVLRQCSNNMFDRIKHAGYSSYSKKVAYPEEDEDEMDHQGTRIMAIAYSSDPLEAAFGAIIDENGVMFAHTRFVHFTKRIDLFAERDRDPKFRESKENSLLKKKDMNDLKAFVLKHKPHVIALGVESYDALRLRRDIQEALMELIRDHSLNVNLQVELVDNEAAKVYMNSHMAMQENTQFPPYLRQALSLARLLWDPLVEYCHLCNPDNDILFCKFHPLQEQILPKDLLNAIQIEIINRVNELGVDINRCMEFPHTANMLQFVCGLGPRKAAHLIKLLKQNDSLLESRTKLVTMCRMGPKVFMNCAGFIKIATDLIQDKTDAYVEVLDSSRVHPETYEWARKMAVDALEADDNADPTGALEEILLQPNKLIELDLEAFAEELARQGFGNKHITLYDIRAELSNRYKDARQEWARQSDDDLFSLVTRDMLSDVKKGRLLCGKVLRVVHQPPRHEEVNEENYQNQIERDESQGVWKCKLCGKPGFNEAYDLVSNHFIFVQRNGRMVSDTHNGGCPGIIIGIQIKFDNGLQAFVRTELISDNPELKDPLERVKIGSPIYCRVINVVTKDGLQTNNPVQVDCSTRSSDLRVPPAEWKDPYFDEEQERKDKEDEARIKSSQNITSRFVKRVISHPSFHNVTCKDAERMLSTMELGEAIIRPSSLGVDFLTVTWKVADDIFQHIVVREKDKRHYFNIGKILYINDESFEDLDEILARYIQPMASFAREVQQYKYYLDGVRSEEREKIEIHLQNEKKRNPTRIPYVITASFKYGGKFVISYMPTSRGKIIHEYFTLTPEGIRFRKRSFNGIEDMVNWFKVHFREVPQQPTRRMDTLPDRTPGSYVGMGGATPSYHNHPVLPPQPPMIKPPPQPIHSFQQISSISDFGQSRQRQSGFDRMDTGFAGGGGFGGGQDGFSGDRKSGGRERGFGGGGFKRESSAGFGAGGDNFGGRRGSGRDGGDDFGGRRGGGRSGGDDFGGRRGGGRGGGYRGSRGGGGRDRDRRDRDSGGFSSNGKGFGSGSGGFGHNDEGFGSSSFD